MRIIFAQLYNGFTGCHLQLDRFLGFVSLFWRISRMDWYSFKGGWKEEWAWSTNGPFLHFMVPAWLNSTLLSFGISSSVKLVVAMLHGGILSVTFRNIFNTTTLHKLSWQIKSKPCWSIIVLEREVAQWWRYRVSTPENLYSPLCSFVWGKFCCGELL